VLAIPASIMLLRILLKQFAQKITMGPGLFLASTLVVVIIALLTISYQAARSAGSNPADSLRYE
jgi:putative ABC transport system permease protein